MIFMMSNRLRRNEWSGTAVILEDVPSRTHAKYMVPVLRRGDQL